MTNTKSKNKGVNNAPEPNENVTSGMLKHFKEMYIDNNYGFCENELYDSVSQLVNFFEKLHSIDIDIQLKRLKTADMSKYEKPSDYTPVFNGTSHVILGTFEFIHLVPKDELDELKTEIADFLVHKNFTNTQYDTIHRNMTDSQRSSLIIAHLLNLAKQEEGRKQKPSYKPKPKEPIQFASLSNSKIYTEKVSFIDQIRFEFIDRDCLQDECGISYYI
jgi:hypothetical protein